ncbi:MAG: ribonuclease H-like domain-containing protein, partial [Proteobacteria bacterium]|nr:ribonuclease H-like domain-containing protein [Pseudomonadota bacterium]
RTRIEDCLAHGRDPAWLAGRFPPAEHWRLFGAFEDRTAFLDIETTGGLGGVEDITVIGIYDGARVHTFIDGRDLDLFEDPLVDKAVVVTFNGGRFDLPVIRRRFQNVHLPPIHLDLLFLLRRCGVRGSLKRIEERLGLRRPEAVRGLDGYDAVLLWQRYLDGDAGALDLLIEYNTQDIVNLQPLMRWAYARLVDQWTSPYRINHAGWPDTDDTDRG